MQDKFDCLIDGYIDHQVGQTGDFLDATLADHLKNNLHALYAGRQMRTAGIGNDVVQGHDALIRSDVIYWLDRAHNDPYENQFFALVDAFIEHLNRTCYAGITGCEFHYALYEKGSFYKRHLDQFRNDKGRAFSMIMYLNAGWQEQDGGELRIYHADRVQTIAPANGNCVFFKSSELEHEVMCTHQPRLSITGWLKR